MTDTITPEESLAPAYDIRFETKAFVLRSLFEKAAGVLPSKDIMPVLKNFQVEVMAGQLRVVATDLELSVISTTEMILTQAEGLAVFPGKKMLEIIRQAEDGDLTLSVIDGVAHVAVGRTTWDIRLQDGSDYPPLPDVESMEMHSIDRSKFLGALHSVRYAAATETTRPSLMLIDISAGKMRAADGVRFQQVDLPDFPLDIQIPIGAVDDLVKLLRSTDHPTLLVGEGENHLVFKVGQDAFIANKLVATFPNVEEILLKPALGNNEELTVDRAELLDAIKRVRITADPETSALVLSLTPGKLSVQSQDKFQNRSQEEMTVGWTSAPRTIVVNHAYLSDMLSMADAPICHFFFGKDIKTVKSMVLLKDTETGMMGIIQQMRSDAAWLE